LMFDHRRRLSQMSKPEDWVIPDILEEHFEEIQYLWIERENAVRSSDYVAEEVARIDKRIEAHVDGIVIGGHHALPLLEAGLAADAGEVTFAAARSLLALRDEGADELVLRALHELEAEALRGVMSAIGHAPLGTVFRALGDVYEKGTPGVAVVAGQLLAARGYFSRAPDRLEEFLGHPDPAVRRAAWAIVALVDGNEGEAQRRSPA
jgi:hypothetical protein